MKKGNWANSVKLGAFVLAGILFLVVLLYMIGKNRNLFGSQYELRSEFRNISGLVKGNNVRYAGIEVGTVRSIHILNDTTIRVTMLVSSDMKSVIRKNAKVSIGSDGLMGNKVINIVPGSGSAEFALENDLLVSQTSIDLDQIWPVLYGAVDNVNQVASRLKETVNRINESSGLWQTLSDPSLPAQVKHTLANLQRASADAAETTHGLSSLVADVQQGRGNLGMLIKDSAAMTQLTLALGRFGQVAGRADSAAAELNLLMSSLRARADTGRGLVNTLLTDTAIVNRIQRSLEHIESGTEAFQKDMEALQHNFLLRPYFRKLEREKGKGKGER